MPDESWDDYRRRSCSEVREKFGQLISSTDFRKEALAWRLGDTATDHLVFVAYFVTESDLADLATVKLS
jgi:hypothetical protein